MPTKNRFRPAGLTYRSYGWIGAPAYDSADVPITWWRSGRKSDRKLFEQQFAYEWFDWGAMRRQGGRSNPPFRTGSAGQLLPSLEGKRILRGFIRRAEFNSAEPISLNRLYFMYNPEVIARDYVSYLDQGALDPFNTVFQSGNLVAPPSFMDFSFELFFDRQDEAQSVDNPGVFVDYEYFDMVVRNVIPRTRGATSNTLPDNGVMMVNPRDITVVFSPNITIQGRPLNARVVFEKFTHRMVPTRMRIALTMRVVYIGPMREMAEYRKEEYVTSNSVPFDRIKSFEYDINYEKLRIVNHGGQVAIGPGTNIGNQRGLGGPANIKARNDALDFAIFKDDLVSIQYDADRRGQLWTYADCSSLVWGAWADPGGPALATRFPGWPAWPDLHGGPATGEMLGNWNTEGWKSAILVWSGDRSANGLWGRRDKMERGDLVFRQPNSIGEDGHVAFVEAVNASSVTVFHAASDVAGTGDDVRHSTYTESSDTEYTHCVRPMPFMSGSSGNSAGASEEGDD